RCAVGSAPRGGDRASARGRCVGDDERRRPPASRRRGCRGDRGRSEARAPRCANRTARRCARTAPRARRQAAMTVLRWIAVAIAVAAAVDPSVTATGRARPTIGLVAPRGAVADTLRRDLHADFSVVDDADPTAAALIVVGDRYPQETIADSARVATVTVPEAAGVRIVSVAAPSNIPPATTIHLEAELLAVDKRGRTTP